MKNFVCTGVLCSLFAGSALAQSAPFQLTSPAFQDNGTMQQAFGGANPKNPSCVGKNISPELSWTTPPAGTQSLVLTITDPEGKNGLGVNHFVAYGIPVGTTGFKEGELSTEHNGYVGGTNTLNTQAYFGPCPPAGTGAHHYIFSLIATDLAPNAIPKGLTKEALWSKIQDHAKGVAVLVGRYAHP